MRPYYPVDMAIPITQRFGENVQNYPKRHGHPGVDYATPTGTKIFAVADGKITRAEYRESGGYGREVNLTFGKWLVIYGHLSAFEVQAGDVVKRGELIGYTGGGLDDPKRGMSTDPHLHFEVRDLTKPQTLPLIGAVDPETWLADDTLLPLRDVVPCNDVVTPPSTVSPVLSLPSASGGILYCTDRCNIRTKPDLDPAYDVGDLPTGYAVESLGEEVTTGKTTFCKVAMWVARDYLRKG